MRLHLNFLNVEGSGRSPWITTPLWAWAYNHVQRSWIQIGIRLCKCRNFLYFLKPTAASSSVHTQRSPLPFSDAGATKNNVILLLEDVPNVSWRRAEPSLSGLKSFRCYRDSFQTHPESVTQIWVNLEDCSVVNGVTLSLQSKAASYHGCATSFGF